ncbi:hypothetical protein [Lentzea sp. NPDC055074]
MRTLLITGILSIVLGVAAAVVSTSHYSIAAEAMDRSERNAAMAQDALRASSQYEESDPRKDEELQKAGRYVSYAESDLDSHNENVDLAAVLTVVSIAAVLTGAILLVVRNRRRTRQDAPRGVEPSTAD